MRDSRQPFDSNHLTPVEEDVQQQQEKRVCTTCSNAQIHQRGGTRVCVEPDAPDTLEVMAGEIICDWWR